MEGSQEDSLSSILGPIPKNPLKKVKWLITLWFLQHPNFWTNPFSISSIFRALTGKFRTLPDFIIIGAAKSGTTSLYDYLSQHPSVHSALWKEIYFFDRYFPRGINWYRSNFQYKIQKLFSTKILKKKFLTGEATPTYFHHPLTAKRISEFLPNIKLIVLLRNPIDRAYSHYQMEKKLGYEELTFEEAINSETSRLEGESEKMFKDLNYFSFKRQIFSYVTTGFYADHLELWMKYFPKNQLLIINSQDLEKNTDKIFQEVLIFLELNPYIAKFKNHNVGKYDKIKENTKKILIDKFELENKKLYKLINKNFNWK